VAGGIFLQFCNRVYYWDGASFQAHYRLAANNLLHWHLIEWGASNGMTQYDMLGANITSIASFKQSFGGELRTYTYAYKDTTLLAYIGRRLYLWLVPQIRHVQFRLGSNP
jgi:lipid II:glycine glycyltransferase (peptidoglycan interpeptide bridge formation enzyme)